MKPLDGVRVIDLSRVLAGPYATMLLADMGAEVIKVEEPGKGDDTRAWPAFAGGESTYFMSVNRGKKSLTLDLKSEAGKTVLRKLVAGADVLVENFRPGVMDRLGFGWDVVHARWPKLVYAAASGFGQTGPLRERPAFDMVVQAMGGIMSLTGYPDGPPARVGVSIGDIVAGLFLVIGIHAALIRRAETGGGALVDVAMLDCQLAILENAFTTHLVTGAVPDRLGTRHPNIAPFQAFEAGDGRLLVVCAGHDVQFAAFCTAIGRSDMLADPRWATPDDRRVNADALVAEAARELRRRPAAEWLAVLESVGVPCAPVNTVAEAVRTPQAAARNMILEIADPVIGRLFVAGNPIKLSGMPDDATHRPPPELDADRAAILAWLESRRTR